jgi:chromate transport protein ChrA
VTAAPDLSATEVPQRQPIRDIVAYFLRLGTLGFGGPVALCGLMEKDLVGDKGWVTRQEMRDAIAVSQSLPGPLAIQVGIFIAYLRGGFWGAWAGGWAFILPNFSIVAVLGALYVHFGGLGWMTAIFYGVSPAVIALIVHSCYRLAKLGMEDWLQWVIAAACFLVTIRLEAEVAVLFIAAGILGIVYYGSLFRGGNTPISLLAIAPVGIGTAKAPTAATLGHLLAFFLKAGSLTFGSGLVIVPFLEKGLVQQTGWLNGRGRHAEPGAGRDHGDLCGLSRRRLLGLAGIDDRHFPAVVYPDPGCCADIGAPPRQSERAGLRQGSLRRGHWDNPRRLRAVGQDRYWRLADGADRCWQSCGPLPLESQQSAAGRRDRSHWADRFSHPPAGLGLGEMTDTHAIEDAERSNNASGALRAGGLSYVGWRLDKRGGTGERRDVGGPFDSGAGRGACGIHVLAHRRRRGWQMGYRS